MMRYDHRIRPASRGALLLLVLGACSGGERSAPAERVAAPPQALSQSRPLRFEDFPVGQVEQVSPASVDLASHPEARQFGTLLQRGAAQGPNFAGRFTVVTWGCGTMCQRAMIVDVRTGRILTELTAPLGFDYRVDSRLLVANPPEAARENPCPTCETAYHLLHEEDRLLEVPRTAWLGDARPSAHYRAVVASVRAEEEPTLLRSNAPDVVRTAWDRLVITARDGSRHVFADEVVGEDLRWVHLFLGYIDRIDAYVVERRYLPAGGEFQLVEAGTGRITPIDAPPAPSPDGERFATATLDLLALFSGNRIRVYRMEESGPVLEWEVEPEEWGAEHPTWLDQRTIRLERSVVDWSTNGRRTSPMLLRRVGGQWTIEPSRAHARDVLLAFLSSLGRQHYPEAALYYGGSYDQLRGWNPELDPDDRSGLLRSACEHNGLQCMGRAEVVRAEQVSPNEVRFTVRLYTDSGELFVRGPCCGATPEEMPPQSEFPFVVRRTGDRYLVQDLPPYVP